MLFSLQTDGRSLFLREDRGPDPVCFLSDGEEGQQLARVQHGRHSVLLSNMAAVEEALGNLHVNVSPSSQLNIPSVWHCLSLSDLFFIELLFALKGTARHLPFSLRKKLCGCGHADRPQPHNDYNTQ